MTTPEYVAWRVVFRKTTKANTYGEWRCTVPGFHRAWLHAIVYLYGSEEDAYSGTGRAGGSGFLLSVPYVHPEAEGRNYGHTYVVTNHHVITNGGRFIRINRVGGGVDVVAINDDGWVEHPAGDDIAVVHILLSNEHVRRTELRRSMLLSRPVVADGWIGPGDEAMFIGRYAGHEGRTENQPTVRRGSIAQMDGDPVWQAERSFEQESILVEIHPLPGFSGSPVFAHRSSVFGPSSDGSGAIIETPQFGQPLYLLGVDWGHHGWTSAVRDRSGRPLESKWHVDGNSGIAMVVPAWKLDELLDEPSLIAERSDWESASLAMITAERAAAITFLDSGQADGTE